MFTKKEKRLIWEGYFTIIGKTWSVVKALESIKQHDRYVLETTG